MKKKEELGDGIEARSKGKRNGWREVKNEERKNREGEKYVEGKTG